MYITSPRTPDTMSIDDLLAHIESRYQDAHKRALPELIELARKVERVHHDVEDAPLGLADALDHIAAELDEVKDLAHGFVPPPGACGS